MCHVHVYVRCVFVFKYMHEYIVVCAWSYVYVCPCPCHVSVCVLTVYCLHVCREDASCDWLISSFQRFQKVVTSSSVPTVTDTISQKPPGSSLALSTACDPTSAREVPAHPRHSVHASLAECLYSYLANLLLSGDTPGSRRITEIQDGFHEKS